MLTDFFHEDAYPFHIIRIERAQCHIFLLQQPPGQAAHFPFRTHIRTGADDDIHSVFLSGTTEGSDIILTCKVKLAFFLFVYIPEDINTNSVHSQRLTHLNTMIPIGLRNTGIVQFGSFYYERLPVQQESILACLKLTGSSLRLCTTEKDDCKKY